MSSVAFQLALEKVGGLVETFQANEGRYTSSVFQEAEVRKDFIDKFFSALGWDVDHDEQTNPYEQEVKVEPPVEAAGQRRADYAFYLTPNYRTVRFFVEAKKPFGEIGTADNYFQIIRYAWSSETPLAVITNFRHFHIVDCRYKPDIGTAEQRVIAKYGYREYLDANKFAEIYWLFSREAVSEGALEKRAKELPKPKSKAKQKGLFPTSYQSIDEAFLNELDQFRITLARSFKSRNIELDGDALTELVQRTLDRLVFMRFLEDRGIEPGRIVKNFGEKSTAWTDFKAASRRLDGVYNGIVFKQHSILDSDTFEVDEEVFSDICDQLTRTDSPYDFDAIPIHILGAIYERFLGNVIVATAKRARVEPKPEFRKAEGVYYTPEYIVSYIVENTVGKLIAGKTPDEIAQMRFADIASGSGSFLLGIFEVLLAHHGQFYNANPKSARKGDCVIIDDKLYLSLKKKREILQNNIFGVDIDPQAIEVSQLSLYLRLLKDETPGTTHQHLLEFAHDARMKKLLPDLNKNVVCGNSLIGNDIVRGSLFASDAAKALNPMDFEDVFPEIMARRRFDAVVGNPPYRMLQPNNTDQEVLDYLKEHYFAAEFKIEMFHLFLQRAVTLIKDKGYLSYIVPTTLLNNVYAETLRKLLMGECCIEQLAVAKGKIFKDADVHTSVVVLRREKSEEVRERHEILTTQHLSAEFAGKPFFETPTIQRTFRSLPGHVWNILVNDTNSDLIRRLMRDSAPLGKVASINRGLITGDRDKFFSTEKRNNRWVPILTGSDVHRYRIQEPSEYVLFERPKSAGGCWDQEVHFAPHKLVVRQISEEPTAGFLAAPTAVTGNIFTARGSSAADELFLLAILNSRLISFFWRTMFADFKESFPQVTIFSPSQVPIIQIQAGTKKGALRSDVIEAVKSMNEAQAGLASSRTDKDGTYYRNRIVSLDRQIDAMIFDLYDIRTSEKELIVG